MIFRWIALFLIVEALIVYYFHDGKERELGMHVNALQKEVDLNYKAFLRQYKKISEVFYTDFEKNKPVLELMRRSYDGNGTDAAIMRNAFIKQVTHEVGLAQDMGFSQVHFHDAHVQSLYRSQMPSKYGDSLADFRYSVANVKEIEEPVFGLEEGRVVNGFRYVYPLFLDNAFIGSVGFSVGTKIMQKELDELFLGQYWIILSRDIIENITFPEMFEKTYEASPIGADFLIEKDIANKNDLNLLSQNITFQSSDTLGSFKNLFAFSFIGDEDYIVIFYPLKNVRMQNIAYLVYAKEDKTVAAIDEKFYFRVAVVSLFWFVVIAFGFSIKRSHSSLLLENVKRKEAEEKLKKLNTNLEVTVRDEIKKRMEKENLILALFNRSPLAFAFADMHRVFVDVNPQMCKMLGFTKEELVGKNVAEFAYPEDEKQNLEYVESMKKGEIDYCTMEKRFVRKDGKIITGNVLLSLIGEEKHYLLGIVEDITERKRMEERQKRQDQILIQQNKMAAMGEMIGVIAHQWRQPLSVLALIIQNIQDAYINGGFNEDFLNESVTKSMVQIEYMSKTIDDFRNFYKPSKEKKHFDIKMSLLNVLRLIDAQLEHNNIQVTLHAAEESFSIEGYRNEFEQSLLNIFTNAKDAILSRKETEADLEGYIDVNLYRKDDHTYLEVKDNGTGLAPEVLERAFEPYFTTKIKTKGTGIGLYMSKMIIEENMNGKITVQNNEDHGATFTIQL